MSMILNWKTTKGDARLIMQIAKLASELAASFGVKYPALEADMDVTACHLNGCPLELALLLSWDDGDFGHDVFGIRRHINRSTGQLEDCFVPRCADTEPIITEPKLSPANLKDAW